MAKSNAVKPVGRIVFVLGTLLVTGTAFALEFLGDELLHLTLLPRYSYALQRVIFFGIFGLYLMAVIDGRLLDAGLPRWYRYPAFAVWLWSISLPVIWPREWLIGVALFALLLIVGYSIPGKPVQVMPASVGESAEPEEKAFAPIKMYRARWLVNPVGFLHSLLTIACLWLPLICLEDASGQGAGVWIARFGYSILSIVWFFNVLGRLDDAGRLPRERYGYIATGFVLLISMLRQWHWFSFSNAAHIASMLLPWLKLINGYEKLALFLLIQVPLALLPSKPRPDEPAPLQKVENKYAKGLGKRRKVAKPYPVGPFEYLCIQLVFACLCLPLIYIDDVSGGSVGSWIARLGYAILGFFWLLFFAFTIPWEYSLDLGEPLGNVARIAGLLLLLVAVPAVLQAGRLRTPGPMQWLVLAFYIWFCCSYFWTIEPQATLEKMRAYFQEMMIVWLVWEFAESVGDLRALLRAYVAGSWVLAALTVANLASAEAIAAGQIRFVAVGQDPNDVARFLDLGFPLAALLLNSESRWPGRLLALGYLPLGLVAVLLTASRGGLLAAVVALAGCALLLGSSRPRKEVLAGAATLPLSQPPSWFTVPHETFERLATIPEQLQGGGLNQRWNIWTAGWHAFVRAPLFGTGAGSFVAPRGWTLWIRLTIRLFRSWWRGLVRFLPGRGHCCAGCAVGLANPWHTAAGDGHYAAGLGHHVAGCHGGGEPLHMAALGADCAGRKACRGGTGEPCRLLSFRCPSS
jgi:hypothetical protein